MIVALILRHKAVGSVGMDVSATVGDSGLNSCLIIRLIGRSDSFYALLCGIVKVRYLWGWDMINRPTRTAMPKPFKANK